MPRSRTRKAHPKPAAAETSAPASAPERTGPVAPSPGGPPLVFIVCVLGVFLLISGFLVVKAWPGYRFTRHREAAIIALEAGRPEEAVPHLQALAAAEPDEPRWLGKLGDAWLEAGRPAEAIEAYRKAIALNPEITSLNDRLGYALYLQNPDDPEGPELLRSVLQDDPDNPRANFYAAVIEFRAGDLQEAARLFQRASAGEQYLERSQPYLREIEQRLLGDLAFSADN